MILLSIIENIHNNMRAVENSKYTAGILIADYNISDHREYILNYLDLFNRDSAKYIHFYIPGYTKTDEEDFDFAIGGAKYKFDRLYFHLTIEEVRRIYGIQYRGKPILILQEFDNNRMTPRRIEIEFNSKNAIRLFEEIFSIAHREISLDEFSKGLKRAKIKRLLPKIIREIIDILTQSDLCEVVMDDSDKLIRYEIKDRL